MITEVTEEIETTKFLRVLRVKVFLETLEFAARARKAPGNYEVDVA